MLVRIHDTRQRSPKFHKEFESAWRPNRRSGTWAEDGEEAEMAKFVLSAFVATVSMVIATFMLYWTSFSSSLDCVLSICSLCCKFSHNN